MSSRLLAGVLIAALAGCATGGDTLTVGAAASTTEVLSELAAASGVSGIEVSVAGSQVLVAQVRDGAPLDVVITADERTARALVEQAGSVTGAVRIAGNRLTIAVAEGNPRGVRGVADLGRPELTIVLAAPEVPAGAYTRRMAELAGVVLAPDSLEPSVRAVLTKVRLGEADAGVVYRTDVVPGDGVAAVAIPDEFNPITDYYAVVVRESAAAGAFVDFLTSPAARTIFASFGFEP